MRWINRPIIVVAVLGLATGFALPTVMGTVITNPAVTCEACTANSPIQGTCNQCGGASISIGSNCDVCCASATQCELKPAANQAVP